MIPGDIAAIAGCATGSAFPGECEVAPTHTWDLCWLATVSRPDICARLARIASRINALQGCDVYRIDELVKIAREWQQATELTYVSSSQLGPGNLAPRDAKMRHRRGKVNGNTRTLAGWSAAAYRGQSSLGQRRLGYVIGLMSPNLCGRCHICHCTSKFTRKVVKSS